MTIIGILGKKRHGKDTMADYLVEKYGMYKVTLSGVLKGICKELFMFTDEQLYGDLKEELDSRWGISPRRAMQFIGTDVMREYATQKLFPHMNGNYWLKRTEAEIEKLRMEHEKNIDIIVADLRFQNEVDWVNNLGGVVIKIERPSVINKDEHISEKDIDNINHYKHFILNDTNVKDYYTKIDTIIKDI